MPSRRLWLLSLLLIGLSQAAFAQINPFRNSSGTPLNGDDMAALNQATVSLLERQQLTAGATETWSNAKSGASGTITAGDPAQRKGLACRVLRYQNTVPGPNPTRNVTVTWCKTKDGWKIA
jgi:surface antigen